MSAVDLIIKAIDSTIAASRKLFDNEFDRLIKSKESSEEKITFSTGDKIAATCISCNKEVITYSISGTWEEGTEEGDCEVKWKCRTFKKLSIKGTRSEVIDKLIRTTEKRSA